MALEDPGRSRIARSTAEGAATLRAAGALLSDPALRGPDELAARMIKWGPSLAALVKVPLLRRTVPRLLARLLPGGVCFELTRTKYFDEVLLEELEAGAEQVVILGAGLDSRAYRLQTAVAGRPVFEVDHPVTAALKRERVRALFGVEPSNVRYVTIDFNREDLAALLAGHDFDPARRSVVLWSGVAPYLEPEGVEATLRWMAGQPPGSTIVFDYCWQEFVAGELDELPGAAALRKRVAAQGEPFRWGIPRGQAATVIAAHGLELVADMDANEGSRRYLTRADGSKLGWTWEFGGIVRARVPL
jgi:methyltransferase (TIGR00027 family)